MVKDWGELIKAKMLEGNLRIMLIVTSYVVVAKRAI